MAEDMSHWQTRARPERVITHGKYVDIVPLSTSKHSTQLFEASKNMDSDSKFTWLAERPPTTQEDFNAWAEVVVASEAPIFYAVIDKATAMVAGACAPVAAL